MFGSRILSLQGTEMSDDGATGGDVTAGDNIWTTDDVRRDRTTMPADLAIRFMTFSDPYLTTVDATPFQIVDAVPGE